MRPKYDQLSKLIYAFYDVPNGYNGHRAIMGLAVHSGVYYAVHAHGYFAMGDSPILPSGSVLIMNVEVQS